MRPIRYLLLITTFSSFWACQKLDIPPVNVIQDKDVFTNQGGITAYMARLYSELPIEDFRYSFYRGFNMFWLISPPSANTGEALSRDAGGATAETFNWDYDYWPGVYKLIRECNYFLQTMPKYAPNYSQALVNQWMGETRMIRAVAYFSLVKRFGGVPLVGKVLNYPVQPIDSMNIPRSSEEKVYDFIAADLDSAYALMPGANQVGRATKYTAAAFKSRIMLFAGSNAKYNQITLFDGSNNKLCGLPAARANEYFKASYAAAKLVEGHASLYMKNWVAGDKQAQYQNFVNLFFDAGSPENIFVKQYHFPESVHGYDAYNIPRQLMGGNGYSSEISPTLDFVEMFDGFPKNPDGTFQNLDPVTGKYILFDNTMSPFANAEPRLRATVILPGDFFKGESIEIRRGIYTGSSAGGISPLLPAGSTGSYPTANLVTSSTATQTAYTLPDGTKINPAGRSGRFTADATCSLSGFFVRKYLNEAMPQANVLENRSDQTWIELRYAEVLLNRAEADYELYLSGASDVDYLQDAFTCMNQIRTRAGATLLGSKADLGSMDIVRKERRKELAFENQTWWDLRRWRIAVNEQNSTSYRILNPFLVADANKKHFFDIRTDELNRRYTFDPRWYYEQIPIAEIQKSPALIQNPGY